MRGKFITIEGIEGAGKSTVVSFIKDFFKDKDLVLTREPGGTEIAEEIRKVLLYPASEKMHPHTELLLMFACRTQHIHECIAPNLSSGKWVVSDRYIDASYAYQGYGRQMDMHIINSLDELFVGDLYPDLTLLMDISPELGFQRADKRNTPKDRIEQEKIDFFKRVRQGYLERAKQDAERIKIIDASQDLAAVQADIAQVLTAFQERVAS
jgi:dTMP kinase